MRPTTLSCTARRRHASTGSKAQYYYHRIYDSSHQQSLECRESRTSSCRMQAVDDPAPVVPDLSDDSSLVRRHTRFFQHFIARAHTSRSLHTPHTLPRHSALSTDQSRDREACCLAACTRVAARRNVRSFAPEGALAWLARPSSRCRARAS